MARIALISPGDVTGRVREIFRVKFHSTSLRAEGLGDAEIVEMQETMSFTTAHTKLVDALAIEPDTWLE